MPYTPGQKMTPEQKREIERRFETHLNRGQVNYLKAGHLDVIETERIGVQFVDPLTQRVMMDGFSSAGSFNVGRHNPEVLSRLIAATESWDLGSAGLLSKPKVELATRLAEIAPGDLDHVLFASGGGEAVDCAIKLARGATGRSRIISTVKAYHGHTGFALSANGKEHYRKYCEPLMPGFRFVPFNDLEAMSRVVDASVAAVIVEPVQGEAGIFVGTDEYMQGLRRLCDRHGALLIFDEIQTGFGRTGKMFACEHSGVTPDLMTVAKSLGGGAFPNAAVLYRPIESLTRFVEKHPEFHLTSSGGSDLGCLASLAVIDFIQKNDLPSHAGRMGARLTEALNRIREENPKIIREVRGRGLMVGIEYLHDFMGPMMSDALARNGIFAAYSGNAPQVMRFMVPITIDDAEMDRLITGIRRAVQHMKKLLPLALPAAQIPWVLQLLNSDVVQTQLFGFFRKVEDFSDSIGARLGRR